VIRPPKNKKTAVGAPVRALIILPDDVDAIWRSLDATLQLDRNINCGIASTANYWHATARCVAEQNRKALSTAHGTLTAWCAAHRCEAKRFLEPLIEGLSEQGEERVAQYVFNGHILLLEQALCGVRDLVAPMPPRRAQWALVAQMVWQEAARGLQSLGREAGTSPKSIAVRFTASVLARLGHPGSTADAVAKVVKNFAAAV
jgi:hypothetical protein